MNKPVSLSVREISKAAKGTVAKTLEQHSKTFSKPDHRVGFFPSRYWVGFVLTDLDHGKVSLDAANKLATDVHHGIAASVPAIKAAKPGAILIDGNLTIGFVPPIEINLIQE